MAGAAFYIRDHIRLHGIPGSSRCYTPAIAIAARLYCGPANAAFFYTTGIALSFSGKYIACG